jgi:thiosulfate/3-mercaptopyruvate sulfurtransferase
MHDLVSSEWLAGALGAPDLMVFDATKYLPNEPFDGLTKYREAHIPGARFFDIDVVADPDTTLPHMAPTAGRFARLMGELGISNTTRVIFYDQKGLQSSARGWWLMKLFGHEKAAVLDGGPAAWGTDLETGAGSPRPPASFTPVPWPAGALATIDEACDRDRLVIDVRARERYRGDEEPIDARPGHIPGAVNAPFADSVGDDGRLRPPAELRAAFADVGITDAAGAIAYCGSGVTACALILRLHDEGVEGSVLYPGSWSDWCARGLAG